MSPNASQRSLPCSFHPLGSQTWGTSLRLREIVVDQSRSWNPASVSRPLTISRLAG